MAQRRRPEILDFLRAEDLHVVEVSGWRDRGSVLFDPRGSVNHHTAGPVLGIHPSLGVLINGRSDLPGPLCNVSLARDGTVYLIAAGRANHAGAGGWQGLVGNSSVWGLEVEHTGVLKTEKTPDPAHWDRMHRIHAAFAKCSGFSAKMVCQHFEWTTRKIDFVNAPQDQFRLAVQAKIEKAAPPAEEDEDDMTIFVQDAFTGWHAVSGVVRTPVTTAEVDTARYFDGLSGKQTVFDRNQASFADWVLRSSTEAHDLDDLVARLNSAVVPRIVAEVVKAMPTSPGQPAPSIAEIEAAASRAVAAGLASLVLRPG